MFPWKLIHLLFKLKKRKYEGLRWKKNEILAYAWSIEGLLCPRVTYCDLEVEIT